MVGSEHVCAYMETSEVVMHGVGVRSVCSRTCGRYYGGVVSLAYTYTTYLMKYRASADENERTFAI